MIIINKNKEKKKKTEMRVLSTTLRSPLFWPVMWKEKSGNWVFACYSCYGIGLFSNFSVYCLDQNQKTQIANSHGYAEFYYNLIYNLWEARL